MENKPLLFIDSVEDMKDSKEKTEYDSRKKVKNVSLNRLEDIQAMLHYKINILVEVKTKNTFYEGVVTELSDSNLILRIDNNTVSIGINEIEDINILKL